MLKNCSNFESVLNVSNFGTNVSNFGTSIKVLVRIITLKNVKYYFITIHKCCSQFDVKSCILLPIKKKSM